MTPRISYARFFGDLGRSTTMGYSSLDHTPKEYFFQHFSGGRQASPKPGVMIWSGLFIFFLLLGLASMIIHAYVIFPWYVIFVEILLYVYLLATFIFCLIYTREKLTTRYPARPAIAAVSWFSNLPISIWFLFSTFAMLLIGSGGSGKIEFTRGLFVSLWSLIMLGVGAAMLIWMHKRMTTRILEGHFREGGARFFGNFGWKKKVPKISVVAFGASLVLIFVSRQVSRLGGGIEWNSSYGPLLLVIASIIISCIFFLFAYLFTLTSVSTYCIKRFEIDAAPIPKMPGNE